MNKKIFKAALLVAVVAVAGLGAYKAQAKGTVLSDIMLANVEALTEDESNINPACPNGCVEGNTGCFCIWYYPNKAEAKWN